MGGAGVEEEGELELLFWRGFFQLGAGGGFVFGGGGMGEKEGKGEGGGGGFYRKQ